MTVLFDTNVILDVLLAREPYADTAAKLMSMAQRGTIKGLIGATTVTTIHYLATKAVGAKAARTHLKSLLSIFEVAAVDRDILTQALDCGFPDYEDAVLHQAAIATGAAGIVTRNTKDFTKSKIAVFTPEELLNVVLAGK
jgi:predicted nucleic acid-binding protein